MFTLSNDYITNEKLIRSDITIETDVTKKSLLQYSLLLKRKIRKHNLKSFIKPLGGIKTFRLLALGYGCNDLSV